MIKNFVLKRSGNKSVLIDFFYKSTGVAKPVVVFCHGYKGYKDWGAWNLMADYFVSLGYFFVKFNFSHNGGTMEQAIDFPDLKAFGKNTFSLELGDLEDVLRFVINYDEFSLEIDSKNISVIGHSRGGAIATINASLGKGVPIKNLITWAGVAHLECRFPKGLKLWWWRTRGVAYIKNSRTKQKMPHYLDIYHDYKKNKSLFDIQNNAKNIMANHLIIHGTNDNVVALQEAYDLKSWNSTSELLIIENMDHALGNKQPWLDKEMPKDLLKVVNATHAFIFKN